MRPTRDTFTVETTVGEAAEAVTMTIDPRAMQHIMGILTDLYADPERAVLREYATNARDAHIAAGSDAPIRVELPTDLRPNLTITDEGIGLSAEDIRAIYSQYGASTKRESDEATGMLGLGCKSALAYADQFTLIARQDGRQVTVAVSRDESGAGVMNLLDERPTAEGNGVAVQVPARRDNRFAEKAAELFRFWPEGTVLVNGEPPQRIEGYELSPELMVVDKTELGERAMIVMGGVPYPAPDLLDGETAKLAHHKALVAWVDIGAVHFAPSREALMDTPTTRRTIEALRAEFSAGKNLALTRELMAADSRGAALAAQVAWQDAMASDTTGTWRGEAVPNEVKLAVTEERWWHLPDTTRYFRAPRSTNHRVRQLPMGVASRAVWVTGFTNSTWTKTMRDKLDRYCGPDGPASDVRAEEGTVEYVLTRADAVTDPWLSKVAVIAWADIRNWKDPDRPAATGGGAGTYAGTYGTWIDGSFRTRYPASDLANDTGPIFWQIKRTVREEDGAADAKALCDHFGEDTRLVVFPESRRNKFLGLFPEARPVEDGRTEAAQAWWAGLREDARTAVVSFRERVSWDRPQVVDLPRSAADPAIGRWNRIVKAWTPELRRASQTHVSYLTDPLDRPAVEDPHDRYPLLDTSGEGAKLPEHMLIYVNAVHEKESQ